MHVPGMRPRYGRAATIPRAVAVTLAGMTEQENPWLCPYCKTELTTPTVRSVDFGSTYESQMAGSQKEGNCPNGHKQQVPEGVWIMNRDNYHYHGTEPA